MRRPSSQTGRSWLDSWLLDGLLLVAFITSAITATGQIGRVAGDSEAVLRVGRGWLAIIATLAALWGFTVARRLWQMMR